MRLLEFLLWGFAVVLIDMIVGAAIWAAVDDKQQRLLNWYSGCPRNISFFAQPFVLMAWPVALWVLYKRKKRHT